MVLILKARYLCVFGARETATKCLPRAPEGLRFNVG